MAGLALTTDANRLIAATTDGVIKLIDPAHGTVTTSFRTGCSRLHGLAIQEWEARDVAVVAAAVTREARVPQSRSGETWAMRVFDLATGDEIPTVGAFQLRRGEEDKPLRSFTIANAGRSLRLAFASTYRKVMVADFTGPVVDPLDQSYAEYHLPDSTGAYAESLAAAPCGDDFLLAAGTDEGDVAIWSFLSGELKSVRNSVHVGRISELCFGSLNGEPVLISGAWDGVLRLWTPALDELLRIEIGDRITTLAVISDRIVVGTTRGILVLRPN